MKDSERLHEIRERLAYYRPMDFYRPDPSPLHYVEDLTFLLAEVERQKEQIERLQRACDKYAGKLGTIIRDTQT